MVVFLTSDRAMWREALLHRPQFCAFGRLWLGFELLQRNEASGQKRTFHSADQSKPRRFEPVLLLSMNLSLC